MQFIQHLKKFRYPAICLFLLTLTHQAQSVEIVRLNIDYDGITHQMDIELYDNDAPLTVANYLNYVNSISTTTVNHQQLVNGVLEETEVCSITKPVFDGLFIYRNVPGFILQTGGFTFRPCDGTVDYIYHLEAFPLNGDFALAFVPNLTVPELQNEFKLSNVRGTIAMALIGNQPNSGNREWFINLKDNPVLDASNFTVFGSVIDDAMSFADEITALPTHPFAGVVLGKRLNIPASIFGDLPVASNYDSVTLEPVRQKHLVLITTIKQTTRPVLRFRDSVFTYDSADIDYGLRAINNPLVKNVTVKNTGNENLTIDAITITDLAAPFRITSENCSNQPLDQGTSLCTINYEFKPTIAGIATDSITISYTSDTSGLSYSVTTYLSGEGVPNTPVLTTSQPAIEFEETVINNSSAEVTITIRNKGGDPLTFTTLAAITGVNNSEFSITNDACDGITLLIGDTCDISTRFNPLATDGLKTASLSIRSNGGDSDIILTGTSRIPVISAKPDISIAAQIGFSASEFHRITNIGTGILQVTNATLSGVDASMFSFLSSCPGIVENVGLVDADLSTDLFCFFKITFTPVDGSNRTAILTIDSNDPVTPSIDVILNGIIDEPKLSVITNFDVGTSEINGVSSTKELVLTNTGATPLLISDITGLDATNFSYTSTCIDVEVVNMVVISTPVEVLPDSTCSIFITFSTAVIGNDSIVLTLQSNDPVNPAINITLNAYGDKDSDGILSNIEAASPNSGDSNNDNTADDIQNNVATLPGKNNQYITFITEDGLLSGQPTALFDVALDIAPGIVPADATFNYGIFSHSIKLPASDGVRLGILVSPGQIPTKFYKFGPTPDNITPHWYNFSYDPITQTGAQFLGENNTKHAATGNNIIVVTYIDGRRGDDDLQVNGVILNNKSGLSFTFVSATDSGSSAMSYQLLLILFFIVYIFRRRYLVSSKG